MNTAAMFAAVFVAALLVSLVCVRLFISVARSRGLIDKPNERSSHTIPTPRGGGVVFVAAWILTTCAMFFMDVDPREVLALLPGAALVAWIGFLDDRAGITAGRRAAVQCFAAALLAVALFPAITGDWLVPLLLFILFATVWSVNLFNFMDGIDGIAGIEALFVFAIGALALEHGGAHTLALSATGVAGLVAGFLWWNWPPAKIFMGDVGSGFLGFLITAYAFAGFCFYGVSLIPWIIAYLVFVFDTNITLVKRTAQKQNIFTAHRSHAYQNLHHVKRWSHKRVDALVIAANAVLALFALGSIYIPDLSWILLATSIVITAIGFFVLHRYLKSPVA